MDAQTVIAIYNKMLLDRGNMQYLWAEVLRFCYPQERKMYDEFGANDTTPGKRRGVPVCTYPVIYADRLGSSLTNSAFPSNDNWFDISIIRPDRKPMSPKDREWCRIARDTTQLKMRQGSNFYQEVGTMMHGLATLGTAGFYIYMKDHELRFRYVPIHKNLYIARNSDGDIDMVAVLHEWTAKEAIEEYGEGVRKLYGDDLVIGSDIVARHRYVQLIYPKVTYGENPFIPGTKKGEKVYKPYCDVTVCLDNPNEIVQVRHHSRFPFAIPRFYVNSDDLYGRSPAMEAMPLIKAMNTMRRTVIDAGVRAIKPPIFVNSMMNNRISIEAGAINRIANFDPNSIWTYPSQSNFNIGIELQTEMQEELKHAFLIDIFQAIDQTDRMTATEVTERVRQKVEAIAPVVARLHKEFSSVVVKQCLNLLIEDMQLKPPPGGFQNVKIEYTSSLDAMIQQGIASKTMTFIAQAAQICQLFQAAPDANAALDMYKILECMLDCAMLPHTYLRSEQDRNAILQQQAQSQAQMQQAQTQSLDSQNALNYAKARRLEQGGTYNGVHI